ncbi:hypothetical protein KKG46_03745 [Patescibacteria group bacterium]|nr:hypothetical protein [Patescibacteria group bacterium]
MKAPFQLFIHHGLTIPPFIGPKILSDKLLLRMVTDFCEQNIPDIDARYFLVNLEQGLQGIVSSGRGPEPAVNQQSRFILDRGQVYLHRKFAYPPRSCLVTVFCVDLFHQKFDRVYAEEYNIHIASHFTHAIVAINVIDGQSDEGSVMVADF